MSEPVNRGHLGRDRVAPTVPDAESSGMYPK